MKRKLIVRQMASGVLAATVVCTTLPYNVLASNEDSIIEKASEEESSKENITTIKTKGDGFINVTDSTGGAYSASTEYPLTLELEDGVKLNLEVYANSGSQIASFIVLDDKGKEIEEESEKDMTVLNKGTYYSTEVTVSGTKTYEVEFIEVGETPSPDDPSEDNKEDPEVTVTPSPSPTPSPTEPEETTPTPSPVPTEPVEEVTPTPEPTSTPSPTPTPTSKPTEISGSPISGSPVNTPSNVTPTPSIDNSGSGIYGSGVSGGVVGGVISELEGEEAEESAITSEVSIAVLDAETKMAKPQGGASLAGAEFAITSLNDAVLRINGQEYSYGDEVTRITTDSTGVAKTGNISLPAGKYRLTQTKAPEGYILESMTNQEFTVPEEGGSQDLGKVYNKVKRGDFSLIVTDESGNGLEGVKFKITSKVKTSLEEDNKDTIGILSTVSEEDLFKNTTNNEEMGTATEDEDVSLEASEDDIYDISEENISEESDDNATTMDDVMNGNYDEDLYASDVATEEPILFATDKNGAYSSDSAYAPHTNNTNKGASSEDGIWVGLSDPTDDRGALPYGEYTIEEVTDGAKPVKFDLSITEDGLTVDLGVATKSSDIQFVNSPVVDNTQLTQGFAVVDSTIIDSIGYMNLVKGNKYSIKTSVVDSETGISVVDDTERTFTATKSDGKLRKEIPFDASNYAGKSVSIVETLYAEGEEDALASSSQIIGFRSPIVTVENVSSDYTGDEDYPTLTISGNTNYLNLIEGLNYAVTYSLVNNETGNPVQLNGETITTTDTINVTSPTGSEEFDLNLDGLNLSEMEVRVVANVTLKDDLVAKNTVVYANDSDSLDTSSVVIEKTDKEKRASLFMHLLEVLSALFGVTIIFGAIKVVSAKVGKGKKKEKSTKKSKK